MNKYCFLFLLLVLMACGKKPIQKAPRWGEIIIRTHNQRIFIHNDTSACFYQTWTFRDSSSEDAIHRIPVMQPAEEFRFTIAEKDSIYNWIDELITNPDSIDKGCTDYVGNASFQVNYGEYTRSCGYYSICEWQNYNAQMTKISGLLKSKIPLVND